MPRKLFAASFLCEIQGKKLKKLTIWLFDKIEKSGLLSCFFGGLAILLQGAIWRFAQKRGTENGFFDKVAFAPLLFEPSSCIIKQSNISLMIFAFYTRKKEKNR